MIMIHSDHHDHPTQILGGSIDFPCNFQLSDFVAGGLTNCRSITNPWKLLLILVGYYIGYINITREINI